MTGRRLAFIPPRYGEGIVGGAELVMKEVAHGLAARGWEVEILTTCARDHFTWANEFAPGVTRDGPVTVRRFSVQIDTPGTDRRRVESMLAQGITPSMPDQQRWMNDGLRVPDLFHHLLDNADDYHGIVVSPYMFWTTFVCGQVAADRTILRPCLHDEPAARLALFEPLFNGVAGVWLQTEPEEELLARHFNPANVEIVGEGIPVPDAYSPEKVRVARGLPERFLLAGGRREGAKGWDVLIEQYSQAARAGIALPLVIFGSGDVHLDDDVADMVIDVGVVGSDELADLFAAADAYIQPSALESFSRTIMESWLAGTPVIANAASDVVAWHIGRCNAGLLYEDAFEFEECLRFISEAPEQAAALAAPGRDYVLDNYTWPITLDRMESTLERWL